MKLIQSLALAAFLHSVDAFGPAKPLYGVQNQGTMTMRVNIADQARGSRLKNILKETGIADTKEAVEQRLVTPEVSKMVERSNWKRRKVMLRKIRNQAQKFDVELGPGFGVP